MSSIRIPDDVPSPLDDSLKIHKAFQRLVCDGPAVIRILAHRSFEQRLRIKEAYQNSYQKDLMQQIESKLHLNFKKAMRLWMLNPPSRDAHLLHDVLSCHSPFSSSKRKQILIEMLYLRSAMDLHQLEHSYKSIFHQSLIQDILASTDDLRGRLFVQYLVTNLDANEVVGMQLNKTAREEAQALHEAIEGRVGYINYDTFINILTTKSGPELHSIFSAYKTEHGKDVYKAISKGAVEDAETIIRDIVKFIVNPPRFFAKVLYKSMKGLGTDDDTLIRVVVTRAEVDMKAIKSEFIEKYKVSLDRAISSDTSHNYRRFLIALVGGNSTYSDSFLSRIRSRLFSEG